jgi:hypothetical protein
METCTLMFSLFNLQQMESCILLLLLLLLLLNYMQRQGSWILIKYLT